MADNPRINLPTSTADVPGLDTALASFVVKALAASGTANGWSPSNSGSGYLLNLTNSGSGRAIHVDNSGTGRGIQITNGANANAGLGITNAGAFNGVNITQSGAGHGIVSTTSAGGNAARFTGTGSTYVAYIRNQTGATAAALMFGNDSVGAAAYGMYGYDKTDGTATASLMMFDHWGQGNTSYGWDMHNRPSSASALVIHQYSQKSGHAAVWVDNCGDQPAVKIINTENATNAPGLFGTGRFLELKRRPATGQAVEDCWYVSGEGVMCAIPKAAAPATLADGMVWVEGAGSAMVLKVRLNGVTKTVTTA